MIPTGLNQYEKRVSKLIFDAPESVAKILKKNNIEVKTPLTLTSITDSTFTALYNKDKNFTNDLNILLTNEGYANIIAALAVSAGLSLVSSFMGGNEAKKQREAMYKIALANLSQQKLLEEERILTEAETERTRILLQTLQQYQSDLQSESTQRLKNVYLYVGMIGACIGVLFGISLILKSENE